MTNRDDYSPYGTGPQGEAGLTSIDAAPPLTASGAELILSEPAGGPVGSRQRARDWLAEEITEQKSLSPFQASMRRLARDKRAMLGLGIIVFFILFGLVGPHIYYNVGPAQSGLGPSFDFDLSGVDLS